MSFPAYPEYKDSGVVWLGGIPAHWNIKKFRYVFEESPEKITDEVVGDMLSVSGYRGIEVKQYDDEGRRRTDEELFGYRVVRPGQLVVNTMWLNYAGLGVSEHEGHVSPAYRSYWIDPAMDKRFIHHLMRSGTYVQGYTRLLTGIRPNSLQMGRDDLMVFPVLLPTKSEQTQIARFLDHETARIDALIEEQQRLIELLKEKRQAVISHAVTKGLDPTVPMKDSGVEWLGDVPAHWEALTLGRVAGSVKTGGTPSDDLPSADIVDGIEWFTPGDFTGNLLLESSEKMVSTRAVKSGDAKVFPAGSVLIVSIGATLGKVGCIRKPASANQQINAVIPGPRVDGYFLAYSLSVKVNAMRFLSNASTIGIMNQERTKEIWLSLPPLQEQQLISAFLDKQTTVIDTLIREANDGVSLLQERRSALISAAVTGKIDVRSWQPPVSTPAPEPAVAEAV